MTGVLAGATVALLVVAVTVFSAGCTLAPWELLRQRYGWDPVDPAPEPDPRPVSEPQLFLVYLDGIGKLTPRQTPVARGVAAQLRELLPAARVLTHTLPYSVLGRQHTEHPVHGRWWRLVRRHAPLLLYAHNVVTMIVACDRRYHEQYREVAAKALLAQLRAAGYPEGSGMPVVLVGYSGGAQVGLLACPVLRAALATPPITLISIGGFLDGAAALAGVGALHHVRSGHDVVERVGRALFSGRWRVRRRSPWNRGRRDGTVCEHRLEGASHVGANGHLSAAAVLPDGRSHLRRTCELVRDVALGATTGRIETDGR